MPWAFKNIQILLWKTHLNQTKIRLSEPEIGISVPEIGDLTNNDMRGKNKLWAARMEI
jgi:hypothetical protein